MIKHVVLSDQTNTLAYDVVVSGSFVAKEKLRSLDHELECIAEEINLLDRAFVHAVKLTTARLPARSHSSGVSQTGSAPSCMRRGA